MAARRSAYRLEEVAIRAIGSRHSCISDQTVAAKTSPLASKVCEDQSVAQHGMMGGVPENGTDKLQRWHLACPLSPVGIPIFPYGHLAPTVYYGKPGLVNDLVSIRVYRIHTTYQPL